MVVLKENGKNECIKIMGWSQKKDGDTLITDININLPNTKPAGESEYITTDNAFSVGDSNKSPESEDYFINPINTDDIQTTISGEPVFIQLSTTDKGFVDQNVSGKKLYKISYKYSNNDSVNDRTNTLIIGNTLRCIFKQAGNINNLIWLADDSDINQKYFAIKTQVGSTESQIISLYNYNTGIKKIFNTDAINQTTQNQDITIYLQPIFSNNSSNNILYIINDNDEKCEYSISHKSGSFPYTINNSKLKFNIPTNSSNINYTFDWTLTNYPTVHLHIVDNLIYIIYSITLWFKANEYTQLHSDQSYIAIYDDIPNIKIAIDGEDLGLTHNIFTNDTSTALFKAIQINTSDHDQQVPITLNITPDSKTVDIFASDYEKSDKTISLFGDDFDQSPEYGSYTMVYTINNIDSVIYDAYEEILNNPIYYIINRNEITDYVSQQLIYQSKIIMIQLRKDPFENTELVKPAQWTIQLKNQQLFNYQDGLSKELVIEYIP